MPNLTKDSLQSCKAKWLVHKLKNDAQSGYEILNTDLVSVRGEPVEPWMKHPSTGSGQTDNFNETL